MLFPKPLSLKEAINIIKRPQFFLFSGPKFGLCLPDEGICDKAEGRLSLDNCGRVTGFSILRNVQTYIAQPAFYSIRRESFFPPLGYNGRYVNLNTHLHLISVVKMIGSNSRLPYKPS